MEFNGEGHEVIVVDNLSNSHRSALERVEHIADRTVTFYESDVRDESALERIFQNHSIDAVIHFAGLKAVGESVSRPLFYYQNNLISSLVLLEVMDRHDVKKLVFSSSATVYGVPERTPITESAPRSATNPYGATKLMIEQMLEDIAFADPTWDITLLRYFNPIGADMSGLIGEDPNGIPNNLMPYVTQVAAGKLDTLQIFGNDYDTDDGTGVRDYIHVVDLAKGHIKALYHDHSGIEAFNLGTGQGTSVLELVATFEDATSLQIDRKITARRPGDVGSCYADASKAERLLGWKAEKDLYDMCKDAWRWQSKNPDGYQK